MRKKVAWKEKMKNEPHTPPAHRKESNEVARMFSMSNTVEFTINRVNYYKAYLCFTAL